MAATPTYRCRLDPAGCPAASHPGYCTTHPWIELQADTAAPAPAPPPAATRPHWALRIIPLDAVVPIPDGGLDIGRDAPRFTRLDGMEALDQISRRHARLTWQGATLMLSDLGSTNGTYVAGRRITDPQPVTPGQALRLADDVDIELLDIDEEL